MQEKTSKKMFSTLLQIARRQPCSYSVLKNLALPRVLSPCFVSKAFHLSTPIKILDKDHPLKKFTTIDKKEETFQQDIDEPVDVKSLVFPTLETYKTLYEGVPYTDLHIACIKATRNNTLVTVTDHKGKTVVIKTAGSEGFRNARKGTNIAGQAAGIAAGEKAVNHGIKYIRVCVQGIGPGRLPSIKGLQMAGLQIVSLTDTTPITFNTDRPRKQRRL